MRSKAGALMIIGIIVTVAGIAIGSVVGLTMTAKAHTVYNGMSGMPSAANTAMTNTTSTIYTSWPLFGIVVLALIGGAALAAITLFK